MPKLLFSRIRFYEIKDLMQNVKRPRRIDIVLNRNRRNKDFQGSMEQKISIKTSPSNPSLETDHKNHMDLKKLLKDKSKKCHQIQILNLSAQHDPPHENALQNDILPLSAEYLEAFRTFLQSEYSEENIDFWLACEDFKSTNSPADLRRKAEAIYQEFIQPTACREINVDHHIREKIRKSLEKPSLSCFDEAQKHVYLLMESDSCPRFLQSDAFLRLRNKSRTMWYI
ncbi:hypothetical protein Q8A73_009285 [Channa argus]|nr:hypothetical protein Q8A73_009285 [Channa argus]